MFHLCSAGRGAETESRFLNICEKASKKGEILRMCVDMSERFQACFDNDGGPIPW